MRFHPLPGVQVERIRVVYHEMILCWSMKISAIYAQSVTVYEAHN